MVTRAILFDLFGTLVSGFSRDIYRASLFDLAGILNVDGDEFSKRWLDDTPNRGRGMYKSIPHVISTYTNLKEEDPRVRLAAKKREDLTISSLQPKHDALATLAELKKRGIKMGLVTNCSQEVPTLILKNPMYPFFDSLSYSSVLGVMKPDERIYRHALESLNVEARDAMFVGDGDCNELTGARKLGIKAVQIKGEELKDAFTLSNKRDSSDIVIEQLSEVLSLLD